MPILFRTHDFSFREMMIDRYGGFIGFLSRPTLEFEVGLVTPSGEMGSEEGAQGEMRGGLWDFRRGGLRGAGGPGGGRGYIRQGGEPFSGDSGFGVVHSL